MQFPEALDSTMVNTFRSCPEKFRIEYLLNLRSKSESIHLKAGGAFARGLEVTRKAFYLDGLTEEASIAEGLRALIETFEDPEVPERSAKTIDRVMGALVYYFDTYKLPSDPIQPAVIGGKPAVEITFAFPLSINHPETGNPLLYCGRFDMIGRFKGIDFVVDEKTTGSMGPSYTNQFKFRAQLYGYDYGALAYGFNVKGHFVRGVAIRKNDFATKEIGPEYCEQWKLDLWYNNLVKTVNRMVYSFRENDWEYNMGDSCSDYGGCPNLGICTSKNPEREYDKFAIVKWNPLKQESNVLKKESLIEH